MEILGKERIASLSTHYTLCTYACLDLDATQVREKKQKGKEGRKRNAERDNIPTRVLGEKKKKGESKEIRLQRIGYMRGKTWDGREANNAFR